MSCAGAQAPSIPSEPPCSPVCSPPAHAPSWSTAAPGPGSSDAPIARAADRSILVTRACYVALRRQNGHELAPTEVALVREPCRSLAPSDVERAVGARVRTAVPFEPAISRAVDAGLLRSRMPRALVRNLDLGEPVRQLAVGGRR